MKNLKNTTTGRKQILKRSEFMMTDNELFHSYAFCPQTTMTTLANYSTSLIISSVA